MNRFGLCSCQTGAAIAASPLAFLGNFHRALDPDQQSSRTAFRQDSATPGDVDNSVERFRIGEPRRKH
jgi:hypothetical protein